MGNLSRLKGRRAEQEVVRLVRGAGLHAARTWHTAQSPDATERVRDVQIGNDSYQVQVGKAGFQHIYPGAGWCQGLGEWLVALRLADYFDLLRGLP